MPLEIFDSLSLDHIPSLEHLADIGPEEFAGLQSGGEDILESSSNGIALAEKKARDLAHSRHKYVLGVIRIMLRNSLRNKFWIMLPGFALSLLVPAPIMHTLRIAFAAFGAHLGLEATEGMKEIMTEGRKRPKHVKHVRGAAPDPDMVLDEHLPPKLTIEEVIENAKHADRNTTIEITAAVIGSIDDLPLLQQATIMGVYGLGMTAGVYGLTTVLVRLEDWGQRLEAWNPENTFGKLLFKTSLPSRTGLVLQEMTPRIFHVLPLLGAAAKFVTSGRVVAHAFPALEHKIEKFAHTVQHLPLIGNDLTGLVTKMVEWGAVGAMTGVGAYATHKVVVKPLVKTVKRSPVFREFGIASFHILLNTMSERGPNKSPQEYRALELSQRPYVHHRRSSSLSNVVLQPV